MTVMMMFVERLVRFMYDFGRSTQLTWLYVLVL